MTKQEAMSMVVAGAPRSYNSWVIEQPGGNFYVSDKARNDVGELAIGVVRKGTTMYEAVLPKAWR